MTYQEILSNLKSGGFASVNDLISNISNSSDIKNYLSSETSPVSFSADKSQPLTPETTPTNAQSPYNFENWIKSKGYTYNFDQGTGEYRINDYLADSSLFNQLNQQGFGTEQQYQGILDNFMNAQNQLNQYTSAYEQQMQDLYKQIEEFSPYETPEELQNYLFNLIESANKPFTYDPSQDVGLAQAQKDVGTQVREVAGARGMLYASGTLGQVARQQGQLVPQFEQKSYSRWADSQNRKVQLATTLMQWDQMQANRSMDQLELIKTKYDYVMAMDSQAFEEFKVMLEQRNWEKEFQLEQEALMLERRIQEMDQAYKRVDAIGYVDNETSVILGMAVGTKAQWVQEIEMEHKKEMERIKKEYENNKKLQEAQTKIDKQLLEYKAKIDKKNQAELMKKQYEYDKKLLEQKHAQDLVTVQGKGNTASIINVAKSLSGLKYVYGGTSPTKGMDCSGFTQYVMKQNGINISRTSASQAKNGKAVSKSSLQAGDLVFFDPNKDGKISHVGIYVGGGKMIHASSSKGVVTVNMNTSYWNSRYKTARRVSGGGGSVSSGGSSSSSKSSSKAGRNASGWATDSIQRALNNVIGTKLADDGDYGPKTTAAVIKFQKKYGLKADGIVGSKTEEKLRSELRKLIYK